MRQRRPMRRLQCFYLLTGCYKFTKGTREFHLAFDLVVIYEIHDDILELHLIRMGTHEEVF